MVGTSKDSTVRLSLFLSLPPFAGCFILPKALNVPRSKMLSVALLYLVGRLETARGAPIQNLTALHKDVAPAWVANPNGRGTWSLLYSCVFTLVLCVWTSIHLNVPPQDDTSLKYWRRKIKWVGCALFAPEIVVYVAFQQWFAAWTFLRELNSLAASAAVDENKAGEQNSKGKPRYNMIYAYYAVMGGFTVDISHFHNILSRATVTTNGILFLAKHGHFLTITEESIRDKSKADVLAKSLVCVQVLWVVGQTIERKAAGYPVTLLEVHTIVHIVCALISYALWIRKPQDVHDPSLISSGDFQGALAFMVLCSKFKSHPEYIRSGWSVRKQNGDVVFSERKSERVGWVPWHWFGNLDRSAMPTCSVIEHGWVGVIRDYTAWNIIDTYTLAGDQPPETVLTMYSGQALASGFGLLAYDYYGWASDVSPKKPLATDRGEKRMLSQKQVAKLNMAGAFLKSNLGSNIDVDRPIDFKQLRLSTRGYQERMLCFREANLENTLWYYVAEPGRAYAAPLLATATVLILTAYGVVHLGASSIMFPTPIERLFWKIACYILICVAAGVGGCYIYDSAALFLRQYTSHDNLLVARFARAVQWPSVQVVALVGRPPKLVWGILLAVPYVPARLYIVIEAFISLRHVPIGVYQTPNSNFMDYIPHL